MTRHFIRAGVMALGMLAVTHVSDAAESGTLLETQPVALSDTVKVGDRVGHMRFLGMLALPDITRNGVRFSQLSGLAWDDDDGILYAISDRGGLFQLQPVFQGNILTGLRLLGATPLRELGEDKPLKSSRADSEGLNILHGRNGRKRDSVLIISFERSPRIMRYKTDGQAAGEYSLPAPLNNEERYSNGNKMLESVCVDPALGPITAPEIPLRNERAGYTRLFDLTGNSWLYPVAANERITDMECLGNGEVLVLQQNYRLSFGQITVTIKRARLRTGTPATQPVTPETLVKLDSQDGFLIDNFEGLTRHKGRRFFMVSDNNDLFVQRSLLMYFELLEE